MAGFPKNFLWGGASAANQCEGGIFEGGRGLANVDVCPSGADRGAVITGYRKMLQMDEGHHYPAAEAVDFYHRFREDIRLLGGMGLQGGPVSQALGLLQCKPSLFWQSVLGKMLLCPL